MTAMIPLYLPIVKGQMLICISGYPICMTPWAYKGMGSVNKGVIFLVGHFIRKMAKLAKNEIFLVVKYFHPTPVPKYAPERVKFCHKTIPTLICQYQNCMNLFRPHTVLIDIINEQPIQLFIIVLFF